MEYTLDEILASIDEMKDSIKKQFKEMNADEFLTSEKRKYKLIDHVTDKLYEISGADQKESLTIIRDELTKKVHNLVGRNKEAMIKLADLEPDKQDMIFEKIDEMIKNLPSQPPSDQSHQSQKR
jgi:hypothetical protein